MLHVNPSAIDWRENEEGILIAFEDSKSLDTQNEYFLKNLTVEKDTLVVIGLGSGFIIDEILNQKKSAKIIVIECRDGLMARQIKKYPQIEFHLFQTWEDFQNYSEIEIWMKPEFQKILNQPALGQQSQFFQEIYYFLNLRTRKSLERIIKLHNSIDDKWLVNLSQFYQARPDRVLDYPKNHTLILQELTK